MSEIDRYFSISNKKMVFYQSDNNCTISFK